jgi:hypothetical protein
VATAYPLGPPPRVEAPGWSPADERVVADADQLPPNVDEEVWTAYDEVNATSQSAIKSPKLSTISCRLEKTAERLFTTVKGVAQFPEKVE